MASSTDDVKGQFVIHSSLHFLGLNNKIPPVFPVISLRRTSKVHLYFPNLGCCHHSFLELLCHLLSPFLQLQTNLNSGPKMGDPDVGLSTERFSALAHSTTTRDPFCHHPPA